MITFLILKKAITVKPIIPIINQTGANYFRAHNEPRDEEDAAKTLNLLEDAGYSLIS